MSEKAVYNSLKNLKELLIHESVFDKILDCFFTCYEENPFFHAISKKSKHPYLKKGIKEICQKFFSQEIQITGLTLFKIKKYNFYHGPFYVQNQCGVAFYFDDILTGMVSFLHEDRQQYFRFSATMLKANSNIVIPHNSKRVLN